jgi:hypothetical protein
LPRAHNAACRDAGGDQWNRSGTPSMRPLSGMYRQDYTTPVLRVSTSAVKPVLRVSTSAVGQTWLRADRMKIDIEGVAGLRLVACSVKRDWNSAS